MPSRGDSVDGTSHGYPQLLFAPSDVNVCFVNFQQFGSAFASSMSLSSCSLYRGNTTDQQMVMWLASLLHFLIFLTRRDKVLHSNSGIWCAVLVQHFDYSNGYLGRKHIGTQIQIDKKQKQMFCGQLD